MINKSTQIKLKILSIDLASSICFQTNKFYSTPWTMSNTLCFCYEITNFTWNSAKNMVFKTKVKNYYSSFVCRKKKLPNAKDRNIRETFCYCSHINLFIISYKFVSICEWKAVNKMKNTQFHKGRWKRNKIFSYNPLVLFRFIYFDQFWCYIIVSMFTMFFMVDEYWLHSQSSAIIYNILKRWTLEIFHIHNTQTNSYWLKLTRRYLVLQIDKIHIKIIKKKFSDTEIKFIIFVCTMTMEL